MIDLQFIGGAQTVTGSKHVLRTSRATVLLECGLFQGRRKESFERNRALPVDIARLDAVIISHAHIDHVGALPVLVARGYQGPIYGTPATRDLCAPMLEDSARIQEADAAHIDRLIARGVDIEHVEPLYTVEDAIAVLGQMIGVPYRRRVNVAPGIDLTFHDAGHILGSAIVVLDIDDEGRRTRIAFTGDLGRGDSPILRAPEVPDGVSCLISESTYGDRLHAPTDEALDLLARTITRTVARGGKVIIPAFALERAQEVIYSLRHLRRADRIPAVPIYVDSPLTVKVTEVFRLHPESLRPGVLARPGEAPFDFEGLKYVSEVEDSKAIDAAPGSAIIIAGSGMCEGGRVLHHLRAFVEDPRTTVIVVGFQAAHTLGRRLVELRPEVRIFGVMRPRHADVVMIDGLSAHADQAGLVGFAERIRERGPLHEVILVHGELAEQTALRDRLASLGFPRIFIPAPGEHVRI